LKVLDGLLDHERLVFNRLHLFHDRVLLDDRSNVSGVGKSVEIVEAHGIGTTGHFVTDHEFGLGLVFAF